MSDIGLRVLYLKQRFDPEPAPIRGSDFTAAMRTHGIEISILTGFPYYPEPEVYEGYKQRLHSQESIAGTTVHRSASLVGHTARPAQRVMSYLSMPATSVFNAMRLGLEADLVMTTLGPAPYAHFALALARRLRVPCVLEMQDLWPESLMASGMWPAKVPVGAVDRFLRFAYRRASAITCLSPGCRDKLIDRGADPSTTVTMLNWSPEVHPNSVDSEAAVELLGDWVDKPFVSYAGAIGPLQGVDKMLASVSEIDAGLLVVGAGRQESQLREIAKQRQVDARFLGQQPLATTRKLLERSVATTVYLESSELDGSAIPSKLAAAMTVGVPVVVAANGETRRLAERIDAGPICEPGSSAGLADSYQAVLDAEPERRAQWIDNAQTFASRKLSARGGIARYARFLETVAQRSPVEPLVDASGELL